MKKLSINIYSKYAIKWTRKGTYISEEDSTPGDLSYSRFENTQVFKTDGGTVLERITRLMQEPDIQELKIQGDEITFEYFSPISGESNNVSLKIEEIKESVTGISS